MIRTKCRNALHSVIIALVLHWTRNPVSTKSNSLPVTSLRHCSCLCNLFLSLAIPTSLFGYLHAFPSLAFLFVLHSLHSIASCFTTLLPVSPISYLFHSLIACTLVTCFTHRLYQSLSGTISLLLAWLLWDRVHSLTICFISWLSVLLLLDTCFYPLSRFFDLIKLASMPLLCGLFVFGAEHCRSSGLKNLRVE